MSQVPTFTPPTRSYVPPVLPSTPAWQQSPAKYWVRHLPRGINVFKLNDGTYTEKQPADPTTIAITYHGGHEHVVSSAEAAALTAAGYGANIT